MSLSLWYWHASGHVALEADAEPVPAPVAPAPVDMISEIVARYAAGDTQAQIGKAFGLSQPKVSKILRKAAQA
jgi:hypothetical protein